MTPEGGASGRAIEARPSARGGRRGGAALPWHGPGNGATSLLARSAAAFRPAAWTAERSSTRASPAAGQGG
jgi:hypothetical protein